MDSFEQNAGSDDDYANQKNETPGLDPSRIDGIIRNLEACQKQGYSEGYECNRAQGYED